MACPSWSVPAGDACPAYAASMKMETCGKEAICRRCYAQKGRYLFKNVLAAQRRRLEWWNATEPKERAAVLAAALALDGSPRYFRCYDSGDFDGPGAATTWLELAERCPHMKLWLPTRTWILPEMLPLLRDLNRHPRIVVRPSAMCFGEHAPEVAGLSAGTSAPLDNAAPGLTADRACPGQCGDCRLCWEAPCLSVEFHRK